MKYLSFLLFALRLAVNIKARLNPCSKVLWIEGEVAVKIRIGKLYRAHVLTTLQKEVMSRSCQALWRNMMVVCLEDLPLTVGLPGFDFGHE